jgi:hypothetical protein
MKVEFVDYKGNEGVVSSDSGSYEWSYEGNIDSILSAILNAERFDEGHGRPDGFSGEIEIDGLTETRPDEKVEYVIKRFRFDGNVHALIVDGERVG